MQVEPARTFAVGCMRLSTDRARDEARGIEVIHAALAAGARLFDTADAYAWDATEVGHNERLLARALATWPGDRSEIAIVTKGGLVRPEGNWVADGRAGHLRRACEASLVALGVAKIDLYLLHAPDAKTPFSTSVRALAEIVEDGLAQEVGLSNVSFTQLEEARALAPITNLQVKLGPFEDRAIRGGVVKRALDLGLRVLAYSPLGGAAGAKRSAREPVFKAIAEEHGATPQEIALAWLGDLHPQLVPLPGPTQLATVLSCARAAKIALSDHDRARLDERFELAATLRPGASRKLFAVPASPASDGAEVVMIMGMPGAGKSTIARELTQAGYARLNRDEMGGRLAGVAVALAQALSKGERRIVLDNTYPSRVLRQPVIEAAARAGVPVRCVVLDISLEDAQVNACERMVARHGKILDPLEMATISKRDANVFPPRVQHRYQRDYETPDASEGISAIEVRRFVRKPDASRTRRGLIVELDGVLWKSRSGARTPGSPGDVEAALEWGTVLRSWVADGWVLAGTSWQPEIAEQGRSREEVERAFAALCDALGVAIDIVYCPHGGGPPVCWCRKPLPGLGVTLARRRGIVLGGSIHVGRAGSDRSFAERLGMRWIEHSEFFGDAAAQ